MVPCISSALPTSSSCVSLFTDATPSGGSAPSTVLGALLDVTLNPTLNGTAISTTSPPPTPRSSTALTSAPGGRNITTASAANLHCGATAAAATTSPAPSPLPDPNPAASTSPSTTPTAATRAPRAPASPARRIYHPRRAARPCRDLLPAGVRGYPGRRSQQRRRPSGSNASFAVSVPNFKAPTRSPSPIPPHRHPHLGAHPRRSLCIQHRRSWPSSKPINSNNVERATSYTLGGAPLPAQKRRRRQLAFPAIGRNRLSGSSTLMFIATNSATAASFTSAPTAPLRGPRPAQTPQSLVPVTIGAPTAGGAVLRRHHLLRSCHRPHALHRLLQPGQQHRHPRDSIHWVPGQHAGLLGRCPQQPLAIYIPVAIIDQNNNGVVDPGDITNITFQGGPIAVTGALANQNLTLPSGNAVANLPNRSTSSPAASQTYGLYFNLNLGPQVACGRHPAQQLQRRQRQLRQHGPLDIASLRRASTTVGSEAQTEFQLYLNLGTTAPTAGDSYPVNVTYSDGSSETLVFEVSNVLSTFATGLACGVAPKADVLRSVTYCSRQAWTEPISYP